MGIETITVLLVTISITITVPTQLYMVTMHVTVWAQYVGYGNGDVTIKQHSYCCNTYHVTVYV